MLGVHSRLRSGAAALSQTASVIGQLWAGLLLASGLLALVGQRAVVELVSYGLGALGIGIGVAGVGTIVPTVFGLGLIVWFVWLGVTLLRRPRQLA